MYLPAVQHSCNRSSDVCPLDIVDMQGAWPSSTSRITLSVRPVLNKSLYSLQGCEMLNGRWSGLPLSQLNSVYGGVKPPRPWACRRLGVSLLEVATAAGAALAAAQGVVQGASDATIGPQFALPDRPFPPPSMLDPQFVRPSRSLR